MEITQWARQAEGLINSLSLSFFYPIPHLYEQSMLEMRKCYRDIVLKKDPGTLVIFTFRVPCHVQPFPCKCDYFKMLMNSSSF